MNCLKNFKKLSDIRFGRWNDKYKKKKYFQENGVMVFYNDFSDTLFAEIPAACRGEVH